MPLTVLTVKGNMKSSVERMHLSRDINYKLYKKIMNYIKLSIKQEQTEI